MDTEVNIQGLRKYNQARLISPYDQAVYITIMSYYNVNTGYATPTIKTIAYDSGMSDRSVARSIKVLETIGLLSINRMSAREGSTSHTYVPRAPIANTDTFNEKFKGADASASENMRVIELRTNKPAKSQRRKSAFSSFGAEKIMEARG